MLTLTAISPNGEDQTPISLVETRARQRRRLTDELSLSSVSLSRF